MLREGTELAVQRSECFRGNSGAPGNTGGNTPAEQEE